MTVNIGKVIYVINGIYAVKQLSNHKRNNIAAFAKPFTNFCVLLTRSDKYILKTNCLTRNNRELDNFK